MPTQKEINALKISGTTFDRRRKISNRQAAEIVNLYLSRKRLGLTIKDIAYKFSIHPSNVTRYVDYKAFLERSNRYSKKYQIKVGKETLSIKRRISYIGHVEYKTELLKVVDEYKSR